MRLQGHKLKDISELVDLSSPTIIAAHKQFLDGGWAAVDVKPRGRPTGNRKLGSTDMTTLLTRALQIPPKSDSPWTLESLAKDTDASSRSTGKYLDECGLSGPNLYRLCKTGGAHKDWLKHDYAAISSEARKQKASIYWAALETCTTDNGLKKYLYAHTARGRYFWLAENHKSDVEHCIDFFTRLAAQASGNICVVWNGHDPYKHPQLRAWMESMPNIRFYAYPGTAFAHPTDLDVPKSHGASAKLAEKPLAEQTLDSTLQTSAANPFSNAEPSTTKLKIIRNLNNMSLTHLQRLEAESIHIMREVIAEADKPVMLYSIGKDSAVMLHLAQKAFYPSAPPFPLLHVDTGWKFREMYEFRDQIVAKMGMELLTHTNPEGIEKGVNPFTHGSALHTDIMKTAALKQALDMHKFDVAFGGARRDEEKSRAKERVFSFRTDQHHWDPKNQRPELWNIYNARKNKGESIRVFPLSNWTELDIWQYIYKESIPVVPLYLAAERPVVMRDDTLIMVDDDRLPMNEGEVPMMKKVRFRTLGCYPLTGAVESEASTLPEVIEEMLLSNLSERQGRMIDHDSAASMEKKKQEGYF